MMQLRLSSLNVRSIRSVCRRAAVLKLLAASKCDIIVLQDCNLLEEPKDAEWPYGAAVWSLGVGKNKGVTVHLKSKKF